jgi:hypothetical protein
MILNRSSVRLRNLCSFPLFCVLTFDKKLANLRHVAQAWDSRTKSVDGHSEIPAAEFILRLT